MYNQVFKFRFYNFGAYRMEQNGRLTNGSLDVLLDLDGARHDKALDILKPHLKLNLSDAEMKEVDSLLNQILQLV